MFKLALLPARQGDCIWISYGAIESPHHLVIDGGPEGAATLRSQIRSKMAKASDSKLHIDLLVVTHVDNDHIGGVLDLIERPPLGLTIGDLWFNAYRHLLPPDRLGPDQGERLSNALDKGKMPWNLAFQNGPVVLPDAGELPQISRQDGLLITLLGPDRSQLARLARVWAKVVAEEVAASRNPKPAEDDLLGRHDPWPPDLSSLAQRTFQSDKGEANGSSIAFLVEYDRKRILFAADAFAARIARSLDRLSDEEKRVKINAIKLSHHGSRKNTSSELLKRLACNQYLISTNGSYFGHPDPEAMARVLRHGGNRPELVFNYHSNYTTRWMDKRIRGAPAFLTRFPEESAEGIELEF